MGAQRPPPGSHKKSNRPNPHGHSQGKTPGSPGHTDLRRSKKRTRNRRRHRRHTIRTGHGRCRDRGAPRGKRTLNRGHDGTLKRSIPHKRLHHLRAGTKDDRCGKPLITLHTYSEVTDITGHAGQFTVTINKKARFVDTEKCKGCIEDCAAVCPVEVSDKYSFGIKKTKAIYIPIPQPVPLKATISDECVGCQLCEKACTSHAVNFSQTDTTLTIDAGAIIVSTGYQPFDATRKEEYGYGRFRDVITNLELEAMLNASSPTHGMPVVPSTGKVAKKVGFIQCVGSRDATVGNIHCSKVCCMSAIKNALLIKEKHPATDVTIHYIDIRAGGDGYEQYYIRAMDAGVDFMRGRVAEVNQYPKLSGNAATAPDTRDFLLSSGLKNHREHRGHREKRDSSVLSVSSVAEKPGTNSLLQEKLERPDTLSLSTPDTQGGLTITTEDTLMSGHNAIDIPYDLVVLSVGIEANKDAAAIGKILKLQKRKDGFFAIAHPKLKPVETHTDGIFIAGCASGPKEIQISVEQGSAAAAKAIKLLNSGTITADPMSAYVNHDLCDGCRLCEEVCEFKKIKVLSIGTGKGNGKGNVKKAVVDNITCKGR